MTRTKDLFHIDNLKPYLTLVIALKIVIPKVYSLEKTLHKLYTNTILINFLGGGRKLNLKEEKKSN